MKLARNVFLAFTLAASVVACGDDDDDNGTGPDDDLVVADLAGDYTITSFTYTPDAGGAPLDLTGQGMGVTELSVEADGDFDGTLVFPHPETGEPTEFPIGGTISISNATANSGELTIAFDAATQMLGILDASETGTIQLNTNADPDRLTMTLTEVTVPDGLPNGGADADLVMVADLN